MHDVHVHVLVTGRSYGLGDIQPGAHGIAKVRPTDESAISIDYKDADGASRSVTVDCYIEPGYTGSIAVDVADGAITQHSIKIHPSP